MNETCPRALRFAWVYLSVFILAAGMAQAADKTPFSAADVLQLKTCTAAAISPNGEWISYTVSVNRAADDEPGAAYSELHLMSVRTGQNRPYVTGKVNASSPAGHPTVPASPS